MTNGRCKSSITKKHKTMKRLQKINVLGHSIKIEYKTWADGQFGSCDPDNRSIKLSHACLEDEALHWETLKHEVMHMILHMSGISFMESNNEEAYVRCIENLILPWIEDNRPQWKSINFIIATSHYCGIILASTCSGLIKHISPHLAFRAARYASL